MIDLIDRSIKYRRKGESPMRLLALVLALLATPAAAQTVTEADGSRTLITEMFVPAAPEIVWQAVTTAEGWKRWAVPAAWTSPVDPDLIETAYDPAAKPGDPNTIQQRFLARLPRRLVIFRTVKTPAGFPHAQAFLGVTQFMELLPEAGGTRVRLTGTGYPAGAEGDALLGFFEPGNRETLDHMAKRLALSPLDFLVGHCWHGTLPNGDADTHCFKPVEDELRDHHEVVRAGKTIYSGDTVYAWSGDAIGWTYRDATGGTMQGKVRAAADGLDFGTADYVGKDGGRLTITTHWVRVAPHAYDARSTGGPQSRVTRYTRID
jgi:uncharacterized protein YndB with AHSA1/START domain